MQTGTPSEVHLSVCVQKECNIAIRPCDESPFKGASIASVAFRNARNTSTDGILGEEFFRFANA